MSAIDAALAGMDARARALLTRLAERDRARGWPRLPMRWPGHVPRMEAVDYWASNEMEKSYEAPPCRR